MSGFKEYLDNSLNEGSNIAEQFLKDNSWIFKKNNDETYSILSYMKTLTIDDFLKAMKIKSTKDKSGNSVYTFKDGSYISHSRNYNTLVALDKK